MRSKLPLTVSLQRKRFQRPHRAPFTFTGAHCMSDKQRTVLHSNTLQKSVFYKLSICVMKWRNHLHKLMMLDNLIPCDHRSLLKIFHCLWCCYKEITKRSLLFFLGYVSAIKVSLTLDGTETWTDGGRTQIGRISSFLQTRRSLHGDFVDKIWWTKHIRCYYIHQEMALLHKWIECTRQTAAV